VIDQKFDVRDQMDRSRYNHAERRHERLVNGEWVPWTVLEMDKRGRDAHARTVARVARGEWREERRGR
jgi:hypothetical protein